MTEPINETQDETLNENGEPLAPIIPPAVLLGVAGVAFLAALIAALLTGLDVVFWGALVVGVLTLVLLVVLAPQQTVNYVTGRSFRFGGTSILVTLLFIAVLMTVYWFVGTLELSVDVTETDEFSLNEQARELVEQFGADPTVPPIELIAFYTTAQIGAQDQLEPLLREYQNASDGKITYRFTNPDRNVALANQYSAGPGSLVIVNTTQDDPEAAEVLTAQQVIDQNQITNAVVEAVASGEFNVYFLDVDDGVSITGQGEAGAALFVEQLGRYNWNFQTVTVSQLTSPESDITLNDPNADGEVLVIAGGSSVLSDDEVAFIEGYLAEGGNVIIAAMPDGNDPALASTDALNETLAANYGLSFGQEIILDPRNARGGLPTLIDVQNVSRDIVLTQYIPQGASVLFNSVRPVEVPEEAPEGVTLYTLAETSRTSFTKTLAELLEGDGERNNDDPRGPFTVLAAAVDGDTGSKLVLSGADTLYMNAFLFGQGLGNFEAGFGTLAWAMDYDQFEAGQQLFLPDFDTRPQDVPVNATAQQLNTINFISLFALPFGILIIGGVVWFFRRQT